MATKEFYSLDIDTKNSIIYTFLEGILLVIFYKFQHIIYQVNFQEEMYILCDSSEGFSLCFAISSNSTDIGTLICKINK